MRHEYDSEVRILTTQKRRISQIVFFLLFVWLLVRTKMSTSSSADTRPLHHVNYFFKLDPLVALVNTLAGHTLSLAIIWTFVILIPTFFLGRFFCGWICPLGSMNQFVDGIRSKSMRRKTRIAANRYKKWQAAKYFLLIVGLLAALCRINMVGWIDPFSLLVRSM